MTNQKRRLPITIFINVFMACCFSSGDRLMAQEGLLRNEVNAIYPAITADDIQHILSAFPEVRDFRKTNVSGHRQRPEIFSFFVNETKLFMHWGPKSVQLYSGFQGVVSFESANTINSKIEFARVTRTNGVMEIMLDLETSGGVTTGAVREWMRTFLAARRFLKSELEKDPTFND